MSQEKCGCQKPEQLKGKPEECSAKQIKTCHCQEEGHPCVEKPKDDGGDRE